MHNVGLLFDDIRNSFEKIGIMIFVVQMVLGARAYGVFVEWYTYRLALMTGMECTADMQQEIIIWRFVHTFSVD